VCEKIHPEAERVKDMLGCFSARRIKIVHHTGEITRRFSLSQLPLGAACGVMILRDDPGKKQKYDAHTSDARGLIAAVCVWPIAQYTQSMSLRVFVVCLFTSCTCYYIQCDINMRH
jgi:hypothetical protein